MPHAEPRAILGVLLAAVVLTVAALLALRQWGERRRRGDDLSGPDAHYFARQDRRRFVGTAVMALMAVCLAIGAGLGRPKDRPTARLLARTWAGVCALVVALLALALLDWAATRAYAIRHRRALAQQHRAGLEADLRRRSAPRDGRSGASNGPPAP